MESNRALILEPSSNKPASYKVIPEADMEEEAVTRPKSLVKSKQSTPEADGADEKMLAKEETVEVKISPSEKQNGDAKLDIGDIRSQFVGLTKEELMKYANDPFWVRLRWFLFITFWVLWGMMLLGAIMIILAAPKCSPPPPRTWWEKGPLAEIGTEEQNIEKLKDLGVTGVIITWPEDAYVDFNETHKFITSVNFYKTHDINVIVELEPGHSDIWFNRSEFNDYYIWVPPKSNGEDPKPPNNWLTTTNTTSWKYSDSRKEFYYAPTGRPHLNFRNPNVTKEFSNVIRKFIRMGAAGIRVKGAPYLLVDSKFEDEPIRQPNNGECGLTDYCFYTHSKTENLRELGSLLKEWRVIVKNMTDNGPFMVSEDLTNIEACKVNSSFVVDLPVQSHLTYRPNMNVAEIVRVLNATFNADNITWPLWKVNSSSEWDIVTYLLPGTPLINLNAENNRDLIKQRDSPSIMRGSFALYLVNNETVLAFTRVTAGNPGILVALNPSQNRTVVDFPAYIKDNMPGDVTVQLFSANYSEPGVDINLKQDAHEIPISPRSALVMSYVPKTES